MLPHVLQSTERAPLGIKDSSALVLGQDDLGRQAGSIDDLVYGVVEEGSDCTPRLRLITKCRRSSLPPTLPARAEYGLSVANAVPESRPLVAESRTGSGSITHPAFGGGRVSAGCWSFWARGLAPGKSGAAPPFV